MLLTTDEVELLKTCDESPEQYIAVFQGQQIGYLRLRHGEFRVDYPDCGDETILYSQEPQGDGCFEDEEREHFLMKAREAIVKKFNEMEGEMTAIANIGSNFVVALPPSDIWLNDSQAAEFLGYRDVHFKAAVCCLPTFPKPRYVIKCGQGRRWNLAELSNWLNEQSDDEPKKGRPRKRG